MGKNERGGKGRALPRVPSIMIDPALVLERRGVYTPIAQSAYPTYARTQARRATSHAGGQRGTGNEKGNERTGMRECEQENANEKQKQREMRERE